MSALRAALARLRARRGRTAVAALGIAAAAAMAGTAVTIGYGLHTGFARASDRADLPDVIARFQPRTRAEVEQRVGGLANVAARSERFELHRVGLFSAGGSSGKGVVQLVPPRGRRGYAVVDGHDLSGRPREALVERGVARKWHLHVGDTIDVGRGGGFTIAGIVVGPDDVAFPLTSTPRIYLPERVAPAGFLRRGRSVNLVMLWARDRSRLDSLLVQARTQSFGLENLRFVTRDGVRSLIDQAAGIVIALLVAFSLVALVAAGVMLGATARTDVARRLPEIGVMRAVGVSRAGLTGRYALDAALVAVPAATIGVGLGAAVASSPSGRLLEILNELPPGAALIAPLLGCVAAVVALVVAATVAPAWRAAGRPPAHLLRGAELRHVTRTARTPAGPIGLGIRVALARRGRTLAVAAVVATSTAVVLLMLALASFLGDLRDNAGTVGKRYDLTVSLPPSQVDAVRSLPGVRAAAPRYEADALDSLDLDQHLKVIAFPGDHTTFESPPLEEGRRVRADDEAEVGLGLAQSLGLRPGSPLTVDLASGGEARFRVVGVVRTIEQDGRVAYVRPARLVATGTAPSPVIAVRLDDGVKPSSLTPALTRLGATPTTAAAGTSDNRAFLGVLAGVLRVVAGVNGLVCLYVLGQALALTAVERRAAIAVLRAAGATRATVAAVLLGVALAVIAVAAPVGVLLQRLVLGPAVARLAAGFTSLPLGASAPAIFVVVLGLVVVAGTAALWVARRVEREPIATGLRET
jgi:predicted lysophospholipase L1 biosynthesis ABC-type transport system permease subunit